MFEMLLCFVFANDVNRHRLAREQAATNAIVALLQNGDREERAWAARRLGEKRTKRTIGVLIQALDDASPLVRGSAASSLREIGDGSAVAPMIRVMAKHDLPASSTKINWSLWAWRTEFCFALQSLTGETFGLDGRRWQEWWQTEGRKRFDTGRMKHDSIVIGMSLEEVEAIMGRKADGAIGNLGCAQWSWRFSDGWVWICFRIDTSDLDIPIRPSTFGVQAPSDQDRFEQTVMKLGSSTQPSGLYSKGLTLP